MDILLVLLRLIHIVAAVVWVGAGATQLFVLSPAFAAAGETGLRFSKVLGSIPAFRMLFPVGAGITMLAGILLYLTGSASHFSQTGNIVLGIGALAGLAAGIHGGAITGRSSAKLGELINRYVTDSGAIAAEGLTTIREEAMRQATHVRVSFVLMVIALIAMGSARYL
jgi:uncharacterized membrane protein